MLPRRSWLTVYVITMAVAYVGWRAYVLLVLR